MIRSRSRFFALVAIMLAATWWSVAGVRAVGQVVIKDVALTSCRFTVLFSCGNVSYRLLCEKPCDDPQKNFACTIQRAMDAQGSYIDNGSFNYHHFVNEYDGGGGAAGCGSCGPRTAGPLGGGLGNLSLERRHRYRDGSWISSYGPGVYSNYDTKLHLFTTSPGAMITVMDPQDVNPRQLVDGVQAEGTPVVADGIFHDVDFKLIKEIRLLDAADAVNPDLGSAVKAVLTRFSGETYTFDVISASSWASTLGVVGRWPLDETAGTTVVDASGNGANGVRQGCAINKVGKQARCYQLNGTSDRIELGSPASLNVSDQVSVTGWIKASNTTGTRTIVSRSNGTEELSLSIVGGTYRWGNSQTAATFSVGTDLNKWVYLTGTFDGQTWKLYRSGLLVAQQAIGTNTTLGAGNWALGASGTYAGGFFAGWLDDLAVFNRGLRDVDVQMLLNDVDRAGRLQTVTDRNGYVTQVTYKTFTAGQLAADPDLQWQIDTVTDPHGRQATFSYHPTQVAGRWVVSRLDLPNSQHVDYTYTDGKLSQVDYPDGTASTFAYGFDATSQCSTVAFHDAAADGSHRHKTAYLTNQAVMTDDKQQLLNQSSLCIRMLEDAAGDVRYLNMRFADGVSAYIYEGAGRMKQIDARSARFLQNGWTFGDPTLGLAAVAGTLEPNYLSGNSATHLTNRQGTWPQIKDEHGVLTKHQYDADAYQTQRTYPDDTTEKWQYDGFKQVTRYEDRLGRVTKTTYDVRGNRTKHETGILNIAGTDTPQPEYAFEEWEYYPSGHANQFLLKTYTDANGNQTDYAYNAEHLLVSVTEPADNGGDPRAVTQYAYDAAGRLTTATDPQGRTMGYEYDERDRVVKVLYDDGSTERTIYGVPGSGLENLVIKRKDRNGVVTAYEYDAAGRINKTIHAAATMDLSDAETPITDPAVRVEETCTYLTGTDLKESCTRAGETTTYAYDYRQRVVATTVQPNTGTTLTSANTFDDKNLLAQTLDPYGRKTYHVYRTSDSARIRTVQGTVPSEGVNNPKTVSRVLTPNAKFLVTDYVLDAEQQATAIVDPRNITTSTVYDSRGRMIRQIQADGTATAAKTETDYDAVGNVVEVRLPRHFDSSDPLVGACKTTAVYTGRNLLKSQTVGFGTAEAATTQYTYNLDGTRATRIDPRSNTWTTLWSSCCANRQTGMLDPSGAGTSTEYDSFGNVTHTQVVSGVDILKETTTRYDARNRPTHQTVWLVDPPAVDPQNPPIAGEDGVSAADGLTTVYTYDENLTDNVGLDNAFATQMTGLGLGTGSDGSAVLVTNPAGERTLAIRDGLGRSVRTVQLDGSGATLTSNNTIYDAVATISGYGDVVETAAADALGNTNKARTDAAGRTIQSVDAEARTSAFTYDAQGNRLSSRDPNNVGMNCTFDELGRDLTCTDTHGETTSKQYDKHGNVKKAIDAKGAFVVTAYDALDRRTATTDRISGLTQFAYDANGNLLSLTDAESRVTSYEYDVRNLRTKETYPDHNLPTVNDLKTFTYDGARRVQTATDQQNDYMTLVYDRAGRLQAREYRDNTKAPTDPANDTDTFNYDAASRMLLAVSGRYTNTVGFGYDAAGRLNTESLTVGGQTYTTGRGYDAANRLTTITYPDSSVVTQTFTARNQLQQVLFDAVSVATFNYDNGGRETLRTFGNGLATTNAYRTDDLISTISTTGLPGFTYAYDANKNRTAEAITGTLANYGYSTGTTGYDSEDRLTAWNRTDGTRNQTWSLTNVGDWTSFIENAVTQTRMHNPVHATTDINGNALTYDPKGNLTTRDDGRTFVWDFDNRLVSTTLSGTTVAFTYDALGRRVSKTASGATTVYVSAGSREIAEYPLATAAGSPTQKFVFGRYIDEPLLMVVGTTKYYYHRNALYNATALTDSTGAIVELYAYDAYGKTTILSPTLTVRTVSSFGNPFCFTGRRLDAESGLYYYRSRYYDTDLGHFTNRDPLSYTDSYSLYTYVSSQPLIFVDPMGRCKVCSASLIVEGKVDDKDLAFKESEGDKPHKAGAKRWSAMEKDAKWTDRYLLDADGKPPLTSGDYQKEYGPADYNSPGVWGSSQMYAIVIDYCDDENGPCKLTIEEHLIVDVHEYIVATDKVTSKQTIETKTHANNEVPHSSNTKPDTISYQLLKTPTNVVCTNRLVLTDTPSLVHANNISVSENAHLTFSLVDDMGHGGSGSFDFDLARRFDSDGKRVAKAATFLYEPLQFIHD